MRIVASMTTLPSRISHIRPAIESILAQGTAVTRLELNLPYHCARTNEDYVVPQWFDDFNRLLIWRVEDQGPITKIAPTLLRYSGDRETSIWSVDDDFAYPKNQLEMLVRHHRPELRRILTRHGGTIQPDGSIKFNYGLMEVSMFEGFGGVLYPPACIDSTFADYVNSAVANPDCRNSDDVVLSLYFTSRGLPIHLCNRPTAEEPFMPTGGLPDPDSLRREERDHRERYRRSIKFLRENLLLSTA